MPWGVRRPSARRSSWKAGSRSPRRSSLWPPVQSTAGRAVPHAWATQPALAGRPYDLSQPNWLMEEIVDGDGDLSRNGKEHP